MAANALDKSESPGSYVREKGGYIYTLIHW